MCDERREFGRDGAGILCHPMRARDPRLQLHAGAHMAVITISRHPGSMGDMLARALAARLQYRLVEREELVRLAERIGGSDVAWERSPELRERSPSFWERLNEERRRYASVLRRVMTQLAEDDNVVIVGLGGGQLLKGLRNVLRLQIIAPPEVRMERVMERGFDEVPGPLSRDRARDLIRSRDRDEIGRASCREGGERGVSMG